ncbi:hypothetical protein PCANC_24195 [Puccinia coronata f. sp. avenae]|uniref:Altered inheritance of mitochondria protein 41 n=1 Tax=Puccinia coronata f. sp. avenae TaxID=200324 RepID=A0A2N5S8E3_9BASI|nr:hypothetical protein PCANC_24195 [Puccinia coronata f. sp. avenae]
MSLATSKISLQYVSSRHLVKGAVLCSTVSPWTYRSRIGISKSSTSPFSSSTASAYSDSVAKGPDDLIPSLRADLKNSMKIKDLTQRDVIKSLLGDLQNSEHSKTRQTHEKVVKSAIKKRLEAAQIALESHPPRPELNQQNLQEVEILKKYLTFFSSTSPSSMDEESLLETVKLSIQQLGLSPDATTEERRNSLGKLIKSVKEKVNDSHVDGKDVASAVRKALGLS